MKILTLCTLLCCFATITYANSGSALNFDDSLLALQKKWAVANYAKNKGLKKNAFLALQEESIKLTTAFPKQAETWIWHGIVQSSYAGFKGGLGAISLVDDAKEALEKALVIDENALQGSAHTSLGILYLKVPGWPVSFGDDDESEKHLKMALKMNPTGIDVNYFLAEFYIEQDEYKKAKDHLLTASSAPARPNRIDADKFRQVEIDTLLTQVKEELGDN
jgi:tetratricopeptide (TPR) repeat protein